MISFAGVAVSLTIGLFALAYGQETDTNTIKTFTSKDGFSFDYPSNWNLIDRENRFTSISATLVNKLVNDNSTWITFEHNKRVNVSDTPNTDRIITAEEDKMTIDTLNTMMQNRWNATLFENGTDKNIVNNVSAPYVIGTFEKCDFLDNCNNYAVMLILMRLDNAIIFGQYLAGWNDFDKYFGQVEKIFQSVKEVS